MRRAVAGLAVVLALAGCAAQARPEGIVERWLLSLNQGAAGDPGAYAPDEASDLVVPGWEELDPGELDTIEVGRATPGDGGTDQVPFRVVTIDGEEVTGIATVDDGRVTAIATDAQTPVGPLPSQGGASAHPTVAAGGWLLAVAVAGILIACSWALMTVVRGRSAPVA